MDILYINLRWKVINIRYPGQLFFVCCITCVGKPCVILLCIDFLWCGIIFYDINAALILSIFVMLSTVCVYWLSQLNAYGFKFFFRFRCWAVSFLSSETELIWASGRQQAKKRSHLLVKWTFVTFLSVILHSSSFSFFFRHIHCHSSISNYSIFFCRSFLFSSCLFQILISYCTFYPSTLIYTFTDILTPLHLFLHTHSVMPTESSAHTHEHLRRCHMSTFLSTSSGTFFPSVRASKIPVCHKGGMYIGMFP